MTAEAHGEDVPSAPAVFGLIEALKKAMADAEAFRARAVRNEELHRLVDQLAPSQAEAVHAVVLQLVATNERSPTGWNQDDSPGRHFAFAGSISAEPDFAERSEEILDEIVRRNAG